MTIQEFLEEYDDPEQAPILTLDGFDEAFVGVQMGFESQCKAIYDLDKVIEILCRDMTHDEALEYFDFNIIGAYVGPATPTFIKIKPCQQN